MNNSKQTLAGVFGAVSTILGEAVTRLLSFYKVGQVDLYQFHSLFLTIDQPSLMLGLIISLIIGFFLGRYVYTCIEKKDARDVIIRSTMSFVFTWLIAEVVYTVFYAGLMDITRPINDHYVYLAGMAISGLTSGLLIKTILYRKA